MDLIVARVSFSVFVTTGILHVRDLPHLIAGYTGLCILVYSYHISGKLWKENDPNWYKYHVLFHVLLMFEQLLILESVIVPRIKYQTKN